MFVRSLLQPHPKADPHLSRRDDGAAFVGPNRGGPQTDVTRAGDCSFCSLQPGRGGATLAARRIEAESVLEGSRGPVMRQTTPFSATASRVHGEHVLTLVGEIDMASGPKFARAAKSFVTGRPGKVVFDMTGVTFMDSTGLTIIAAAVNRIAPGGGRLCIRGASPLICRLFEITGICESEYLEIARADDDLPSAANG